jgi:hypothetical protein
MKKESTIRKEKEIVEKIKALSKTHTPRQIANELKINYDTVTVMQTDPANGIINPKRAGSTSGVRRDRSKVAEGCFDIDNMRPFIY